MERNNSTNSIPVPGQFQFTPQLDLLLDHEYSMNHTHPLFGTSESTYFEPVAPSNQCTAPASHVCTVSPLDCQQPKDSVPVPVARNKPIQNKRSIKNHAALNRKIESMARRIEDLENQIKILKGKNFCYKCGSKEMEKPTSVSLPALQNQFSQMRIDDCNKFIPPSIPALPDCFKEYAKMVGVAEETPVSREFEGFSMEGMTPNPPSENLDVSGQLWIIMGLLMMIMGININGYDGTVDIYKITRQNVDYIRKQVQKSKDTINFPVFFSKVFSLEGSLGMSNQIANEGFELEGLRIQSIDEQDLMFQEHLNFELKYEALIVMMEYMRQYASLS